MVHVSSSCNPAFHFTGAHYINADTTAFMQFITSDVFRDFPTLKFVIPHGGGAVPYHWGRYRGLAQDMGKPPLKELLLAQRLLRHLRLSPARHRAAAQGDPGGQHPLRLRDRRRGARRGSGDRATITTTRGATSTRYRGSAPPSARRSTLATSAACTRGSTGGEPHENQACRSAGRSVPRRNRPRAGVSEQAGAHRRALAAERQRGHHRAHARAGLRRGARPAGDRREPRRRRRHHRHGRGGEVARRRLHAAARLERHHHLRARRCSRTCPTTR